VGTTNYKSDFDMHYGASENIIAKAKELRHQQTKAEKILWNKLRNNNILSFKFRRQHPVDISIVDFYCHKAKLVIEVDGKIHQKKDILEYDINRTAHLEEFGLKIIRFTNYEIENQIEKVLKKIKQVLIERNSF